MNEKQVAGARVAAPNGSSAGGAASVSEMLDAVKALDVALSRQMIRALAGAPVPYSQAGVLHFLAGRQGRDTSNRQIEAHFGISNPAVSALLKKLRAGGFITMQVADSDRRFRLAQLTAAGEQAEAVARQRLEAVTERLTAGFDAVEIAQFRAFIERARANLESE